MEFLRNFTFYYEMYDNDVSNWVYTSIRVPYLSIFQFVFLHIHFAGLSANQNQQLLLSY